MTLVGVRSITATRRAAADERRGDVSDTPGKLLALQKRAELVINVLHVEHRRGESTPGG